MYFLKPIIMCSMKCISEGHLDLCFKKYFLKYKILNINFGMQFLYRVVDTCDDHEPCSWEQNDSGRV